MRGFSSSTSTYLLLMMMEVSYSLKKYLVRTRMDFWTMVLVSNAIPYSNKSYLLGIRKKHG